MVDRLLCMFNLQFLLSAFVMSFDQYQMLNLFGPSTMKDSSFVHPSKETEPSETSSGTSTPRLLGIETIRPPRR